MSALASPGMLVNVDIVFSVIRVLCKNEGTVLTDAVVADPVEKAMSLFVVTYEVP